MRTLYPQIDPYEKGMLPVGDGHELYYERSGAPGGKPAIFIHGGPGAGFSPDHRRLFNPHLYDLVLFDQRGCGKSRPHASTTENTTWHLVEDIEQLRRSFGIDRWLIFGGSWGSTLALAYAERYPQRASELVLRGIFLGSRDELNWFYRWGASEIFPKEWEAFLTPIPLGERDNTIKAYARLLNCSDGRSQVAAARAWSAWEGATVSLLPSTERAMSYADERFALAVARIENHYFSHGCWLDPDQLVAGAEVLKGIPITIVHGRYDMCCPMRNVWKLQKVLPWADLRIVEGAGHVFSEPGILDQLICATDNYASLG